MVKSVGKLRETSSKLNRHNFSKYTWNAHLNGKKLQTKDYKTISSVVFTFKITSQVLDCGGPHGITIHGYTPTLSSVQNTSSWDCGELPVAVRQCLDDLALQPASLLHSFHSTSSSSSSPPPIRAFIFNLASWLCLPSIKT